MDVPIVGMVETTSPSFSLYRTVVFPAPSKPTWKQNQKSTQPTKKQDLSSAKSTISITIIQQDRRNYGGAVYTGKGLINFITLFR